MGQTCTVDQEIFTLKNHSHKKLSCCDRDVRSSFDPQNFCSGSQLQCGRVPGEFLVFSLLPGIGRAWYHWLYIVVDQRFTSGGRVDLHTLIH